MRLETAQVLGKRKAMLRKIELFKTLCKSIWKSEGRDAVLTYAVEAIEEVEVDIEEDFEDEEELLPPDDLVELEET